MNRCNNDSNGDPSTNGEYRLLKDLSFTLLQRGAVIFDVGANIGEWPEKLTDEIQAAVDVYAFELFSKHGYIIGKIYPRGIRWLEKYDQTLESFQYSNYVAVQIALSAGFAKGV